MIFEQKNRCFSLDVRLVRRLAKDVTFYKIFTILSWLCNEFNHVHLFLFPFLHIVLRRYTFSTLLSFFPSLFPSFSFALSLFSLKQLNIFFIRLSIPFENYIPIRIDPFLTKKFHDDWRTNLPRAVFTPYSSATGYVNECSCSLKITLLV